MHATGYGSETINPQGKVDLAYSGYKEPGHITDTARERVLILPKKSIAGDTGELPLTFRGEGQAGQRHRFGESDDMYVIGWSRLTDRYGKIPQKVEGPQTKINVKKLKKDLTKNNNTLNGLYAETKSKLSRLAGQRDFNQADIDEIMEEFGDTFKPTVVAKYADQIDQVSPGLVDQMDELVVKNRDLTDQISKAETPSAEGVVRVTFADEIQSDLMQEAAKRKKFLAGTLRRMQDQGKSIDDLSDYDELNKQVMQFYKENESIFRPETKTAAEVDIMRQQLTKMDEEVDSIVNKYIATREISDKDLTRLGEMLQTNLDNLLNKVMTIDSNTMGKLFPNLPFKNRNEWADAVIKKDLYEAAYRKFVLKDPNEVDIMRQQLTKMDEEVDSIVNKYIATREISDKDLTRLGEMLQTNLDNLLNKVMTIDSNTMGKLFPNLPFKNRNEWADAVIKKDLYEAAYRKFVLKDPNAADYYAVTPDRDWETIYPLCLNQ